MYKIVICDDDKNFISYMKEMLLRCDLSERQVTFYEVTSGEECLLTVERMTSCDLIILDMQMSGMDGHGKAVQKIISGFFISILFWCIKTYG